MYSLVFDFDNDDVRDVDLSDERSYKLKVRNSNELDADSEEDLQFVCDSIKTARPWWIPPSSVVHTHERHKH